MVRGSRDQIFAILAPLRLAQARAFARCLVILGRRSWGARLIRWARANPPVMRALQWLLAFCGTYASLEEAKACAARYIAASHDHPWQISLHAQFAEVTRESDYPVLFFLAPIAPKLETAFDLGGSIGNLFFQLNRHLPLSERLVWTVHDLPFKKTPFQEFAKKKGESRLRFTEDISSASGVDLFIAVGALHFFDLKLAELLRPLDKLPKHVIANRSPFSDGEDIAMIQDGGLWLNACKLHSVKELVRGMEQLGYELVARWPVHERRQLIPLYPEYNEPYSGFYFRLAKGED
jgi:putative methyltransferase (TIGR04325 family)